MTILHFEGFRNLGTFRYESTRNTSVNLSTGSVSGLGIATPSNGYTLNNVSIVQGRTIGTYAAQMGSESVSSNNPYQYGNPIFVKDFSPAHEIISSGCAWSSIRPPSPFGNIISVGDLILVRSNTQLQLRYRQSPTYSDLISLVNVSDELTEIDTWAYYELKVDLVSNRIQVRVDEITVIDISTDEVPYNLTEHGNYQVSLAPWGHSVANNHWGNRWADWYITDSDFLGDCRVEIFTPNADVRKEWTPNAGVINYNRIDSSVENFTNYLWSTTPGATDVFSHTNVIGENYQGIEAIRVVGTTDVENSSAGWMRSGLPYYKPKLRLELGGAVVSAPDPAPNSNGLHIEPLIVENNPQSGLPWTKTTSEAIRFGVELTGVI